MIKAAAAAATATTVKLEGIIKKVLIGGYWRLVIVEITGN